MKFRDHLSALMLPFGALILIPAALLSVSQDTTMGGEVPYLINIIILLFGVSILLVGFALMVLTIKMFYQIGKGTLAPWAPTQRIVMNGIYLRTRNPMISGVILIIVGEGVLFSSWLILLWSFVFFIVNHFYFIFSEEPGLQKRFGEDYLRYKKNVPRWIPQRNPWNPNHKAGE
ncbi:isoprenylcysteine carboxylmethyltransferase family protein [Candidatus Thorarchaeota archaeon]|nr:MAG: isoprenylcysteine carboxylmethyltransferase family protein [Candidatus Thorarchaeota archaeon]